ncbi:YutD family protein [Longirhabdus pacifica]|uniref:YutD family protein n=1 Tax=Longirhabdus pacifica TaxID=2305227 RepID=UPI001008D9F2|nr:YutD family protein [Longirhabdus pacifica]
MTIHIGGKNYELLTDYRDGWNLEVFRARYSDVLDRYDYIVGDWGYNQLRLKGFYHDGHGRNKESCIQYVEDYLYEYCNFGCAYFIIKKVKQKELQKVSQ